MKAQKPKIIISLDQNGPLGSDETYRIPIRHHNLLMLTKVNSTKHKASKTQNIIKHEVHVQQKLWSNRCILKKIIIIDLKNMK